MEFNIKADQLTNNQPFLDACKKFDVEPTRSQYVTFGRYVEQFEGPSISWLFNKVIIVFTSLISQSYEESWHKFRAKQFIKQFAPQLAPGTLTIKERTIKVGLPNIGNSCYINADIQLLLSLSKEELEKITSNIQGYTLRNAFKNVVNLARKEGATAASMTSAMESLRDAVFNSGSVDFNQEEKWDQQDAAAFLRIILNGSQVNFKHSTHVADLNVNTEYAPRDQTENLSVIPIPVKGNFQNCLKGFCEENVNDPANALNVVSKVNGSIRKASQFTHNYHLNQAPPEILVFQMKRFVHEPSGILNSVKGLFWDQNVGGYSTKLTSNIDLPDKLDMSLCATDEIKAHYKDQCNYELVGVVNHLGQSLNSGHYVADVKRNGRWFHCNDSSVTPKASSWFGSSLDNNNSYVVMYKKV